MSGPELQAGAAAVEVRPQGDDVVDANALPRSTSPVGTDTGLLPLSLVECAICLALLCEPITTPCGHSFCRPCLVSTLRKNKKKCPSCRSVCHIEAETHSENITLVNVLRASFPGLYEARLAEVTAEKEGWARVLPIFFYNDTLFPYSPLSLHLFEPRYKVMCKRIVNGSRKFAYLPCFQSYTASVGDIGVVADLTECEFLPDGRALLQAKCRERFHVLETWVEDGTQGLHWCKVAKLPDDETAAAARAKDAPLARAVQEQAAECSRTFEAMMDRFAGLRSDIDSNYGPKPTENAEMLSFWLAAVLPVHYTNKHSLLTTTSTLTRLRVLKTFMMEHLSAVQPGEGPGTGSVSDDDDEEVEAEQELEADGSSPSRAGAL